MRLRFAAVGLCLALAACADAQTPSSAESTVSEDEVVVVVDGRDLEGGADTEVWASSPAVQAAIQAARAHWTANEPGYEEEVRVLDVADGAFTSAGASEQAVLYLMGLWPRCCPKVGLAIVDGGPEGRLVANVAFESVTQKIRPVQDLDGDGLDELVLVGSFGMGGSTSSSATLVGFASGELAAQGGVGIYEGACGAMRDGETAMRVLAAPGPSLTVETYTRATCEGGTWERSGEPEPLLLEPPADNIYESLPVN